MAKDDQRTFEPFQDDPRSYSLGPLPWSREQLIKDYWSNFVAAFEHIKEHPGFAANQGLDDIQSALEVFLDAAQDLFAGISIFREEADRGELYGRGSQWRLEELERRVRKCFHSNQRRVCAC